VNGVIDLVRSRGAVAQLCVIADGEVVLDVAVGCRPDALFWVFSASKPFVALLVHQLAERGELDLDDPVGKHWPEFGKPDITVRHVLQHRAGIPTVHGAARDMLAMTDWRRSVRAIERAAPRYPAGAVPAYHVVTFGFILGELVRRVTGTPVEQVLQERLVAPLGLRDIHLGLPPGEWGRHVPVRGHGRAAKLAQVYVNRRRAREAVIPAAGISATARDIAGFYDTLLRGGGPVLRPETVAEARIPSSDGEVDRFLGVQTRWSQGFQLGGPVDDGVRARAMGRLSSTETFGHNGSNCCIAWADPTRRLAFAYLTSQLGPRHLGARHIAAVADAVIAARAGDGGKG